MNGGYIVNAVLCNDFELSLHGSGASAKTIITMIAPIPDIKRKQLVFSGDYREWVHGQWEFARRLVRQYWQREDLCQELENMETNIRKQRIREEVPLVDDDEDALPQFWAAHTLEVHVSRTRGYVRIYGRTFEIREELKRRRFQWYSARKYWHTEYSEENIKNAVEIAKKYDEKFDPVENNLSRCPCCNRWTLPRAQVISLMWGGGCWCFQKRR